MSKNYQYHKNTPLPIDSNSWFFSYDFEDRNTWPFLSFSFTLSFYHTHTHTHTVMHVHMKDA